MLPVEYMPDASVEEIKQKLNDLSYAVRGDGMKPDMVLMFTERILKRKFPKDAILRGIDSLVDTYEGFRVSLKPIIEAIAKQSGSVYPGCDKCGYSGWVQMYHPKTDIGNAHCSCDKGVHYRESHDVASTSEAISRNYSLTMTSK